MKDFIIEYERARGERLRADIRDYKGREYFSFRVWWQDPAGEMKPGKNGLNLPMDEQDDFLRCVVATFPDRVRLIDPEQPAVREGE
jgi:hypothetical protein